VFIKAHVGRIYNSIYFWSIFDSVINDFKNLLFEIIPRLDFEFLVFNVFNHAREKADKMRGQCPSCIAKPTIKRINNIHCLESSLYSEVLGVAGSVDTIADFDDELAVIDYKTSKEPKPIEWLEGYFVQAMFYGMAFYEMTGIKIKSMRNHNAPSTISKN